MAEKILDEIYALLNKYYEEKGKEEANKSQEIKEQETKVIVKESNIRKKDAIETEVVTVKLLAQTNKGLQVVFNGIEEWVPKSKIHNDFKYVQDQEVTLFIETWVLEKNFKWVKK